MPHSGKKVSKQMPGVHKYSMPGEGSLHKKGSSLKGGKAQKGKHGDSPMKYRKK